MRKPKKWDSMTMEEQEAWIVRGKELQQKASKKWQESEKGITYNKKYKSTETYKQKSKEWAKSYQARMLLLDPNLKKCRKYKKETHRKYYLLNIEKSRLKYRKWVLANIEKRNEYQKKWASNLPDSLIASKLGISVSQLRNHPDLLSAKREQIKTLRQLKQQTRKQTQCTRIQATCNKSATTSQKPPTPHGSTSLLSLELSSWSTPWVRQLTLLLLKSKRQS